MSVRKGTSLVRGLYDTLHSVEKVRCRSSLSCPAPYRQGCATIKLSMMSKAAIPHHIDAVSKSSLQSMPSVLQTLSLLVVAQLAMKSGELLHSVFGKYDFSIVISAVVYVAYISSFTHNLYVLL